MRRKGKCCRGSPPQAAYPALPDTFLLWEWETALYAFVPEEPAFCFTRFLKMYIIFVV